jgi:hypothetical protein
MVALRNRKYYKVSLVKLSSFKHSTQLAKEGNYNYDRSRMKAIGKLAYNKKKTTLLTNP